MWGTFSNVGCGVGLRVDTSRVTKGVGIVQYSTIQKKHMSKIPPSTLTSTKIPLEKQCRHAVPRPFQPLPPRTLDDCCVVEVGDWVAQSNSPARLQIATSILPPPRPKIRQTSTCKTEAAKPSPRPSSPRPSVHWLIVVSLMWRPGGAV